MHFEARHKTKALYEIEEPISTRREKKDTARVTKEELTTISEEKGTEEQAILLRRICYQDQKSRKYEFLSNTMMIQAEEITLIYRKR